MQGTVNTPLDLFTLAGKPLADRITALESVWAEPDRPGSLPPHTVQISGLIVAEAIRLIRLGTTTELADSSLQVARVLSRREGRSLSERHPQAHRLLSAAAVALAAASAPSSPAGEWNVLVSWNGKAKEAVRLLNESEGRAMARADLRARLGEPAESHLSHMLADLEAAGLVVRIREGRNVVVHLGPAARSKEIQERIAPPPKPTWTQGGFEPEVSIAPMRMLRAFSFDTGITLTAPEGEMIDHWTRVSLPSPMYTWRGLYEPGRSTILDTERAPEDYSRPAPVGDDHVLFLSGALIGGLSDHHPDS